MEKIIHFKNCSILRNHQIIREDLWVQNGKIINPEPLFFVEKKSARETVDCNGILIAPGFIDIQINGAFGMDFSYDVDRTAEGVAMVAKKILSHGVTSFCPTLVTSSPQIYRKVLPLIPKQGGGEHGAGILGVHLEGPFINPEKKGAHNKSLIQSFDSGFSTLLDVYGGDLSNVGIVTLAPELPRAVEVIRELKSLGITVALGHSEANLIQGEEAVRNGATLITHLFNAMLPFHHRDPGLVGLLTSNLIPPDTIVFYGIIADGIHTHPAALRIAYKTHSRGIVLVTDAISPMGLSEGIHHLGSLALEVKDNRAVIAGTEILCGSMATIPKSIHQYIKSARCSTVEALEAASLHPALALGIDNMKGTLDFDTDADFVMLDQTLNICSTWINGQSVYEKEPISETE